MGAKAIGIAKETVFKTAVAPTMLIPGTEDFAVDKPLIFEEVPYGGRALSASSPGRQSLAGNISGLSVRADYIGHLFKAVLGTISSTGAGPYVHTFKRAADDVAAGQALPSYSVQTEKDGVRNRFWGCQFNGFSLDFDATSRVKFSTDVIAAGFTRAPTAMALSPSALVAFSFPHVAHTLGGSAFAKIGAASLKFDNGITSVPLQDATTGQSLFFLGAQPKLMVDFDVWGYDTTIETAFDAGTTVALVFKWTIDANNVLEVNCPKVRIQGWKNSIDGFDTSPAKFSGVAEYDSGIASEFEVKVTNALAGATY